MMTKIIKMTASQFDEMHFHAYFESCPEEVIKKLRTDEDPRLDDYTLESLIWIQCEADAYSELWKSNAETSNCDSDHTEALKYQNLKRSMEALAKKCEALIQIKKT